MWNTQHKILIIQEKLQVTIGRKWRHSTMHTSDQMCSPVEQIWGVKNDYVSSCRLIINLNGNARSSCDGPLNPSCHPAEDSHDWIGRVRLLNSEISPRANRYILQYPKYHITNKWASHYAQEAYPIPLSYLIFSTLNLWGLISRNSKDHRSSIERRLQFYDAILLIIYKALKSGIHVRTFSYPEAILYRREKNGCKMAKHSSYSK